MNGSEQAGGNARPGLQLENERAANARGPEPRNQPLQTLKHPAPLGGETCFFVDPGGTHHQVRLQPSDTPASLMPDQRLPVLLTGYVKNFSANQAGAGPESRVEQEGVEVNESEGTDVRTGPAINREHFSPGRNLQFDILPEALDRDGFDPALDDGLRQAQVQCPEDVIQSGRDAAGAKVAALPTVRRMRQRLERCGSPTLEDDDREVSL